jgi:hypothetical protein
MVLESLMNAELQSILSNPWVLTLLIITTAWKFLWYGLALWKTIEDKKKYHFMVFFALMMVVNDLGIIPIIYLVWNRYKAKNGSTGTKKKA